MAKTPVARRKLVTPQCVVKLMEAIGPTRAADRLGVSTTLLHKARKENEVNRVVEIAAANILEHLGDGAAQQTHKPATQHHAPAKPAGRDSIFLLAVTADKAELVERFAAALGAEVVVA